MAISATGNSADAGFSLVEAMTALMIVSLMAAVVLLLAPGEDRETRLEAERIAARLVMAGDESVIANRTLALVVTRDGYGFERLEDNGWFPAERNSPLGFRPWPDHLDVQVEGDDPERDERRVAQFDPLGASTPVSLLLRGAGAEWRVAIDGDGEPHVAPAQ